ncbi:arsenate reductase [Alteriqipengyuania flavescens]|uniref:arsenate reductase n=1 Tax=Alteriqipengyuania flavescens TaxID=3053610 RepID=UPI0025B4534B|nr:arsenate reductase [Alteriqipengyuania flavescens]WJY19814.1 arsenate reductase [Alteriqipengyuania flavescens]WJY25756.1 arsenate reductase [Alteriqipengyuania flavescens]
MIDLYGIPNCDTVKKARKWLEAKGLDHTFHDFKKEPPSRGMVGEWADAVGWQVLLNRRGTTFRKLDDADKEGLDRDKAVELMVAHPSMIKRPVVTHDGQTDVGFNETIWENAYL